MVDRTPSSSPIARGWISRVLVPLAVLGAALIVYGFRYLPALSPTLPRIGADYSYFLPNMLAGDYWFHQNGLGAVPWMTPAFCGGVPFYANPQSFYYSPAQWLTFIVSPLTAVRITFLLYAGVGALGMYALLKRSFRTSNSAALLGGVVFLFNGFYSHRMLIGHFAFHPFMLTPVVAALLLEEGAGFRWIRNGLAAGIVIALMIQSGMIVILPLVMLAVFWLGSLSGFRSGGWGRFLGGLGVSLATAVALSAAKLYAATQYLSHFTREHYPLPGVPSLGRLLGVAARMLFWRADPAIEQAFVNGRVQMSLHEWEYGLSPVPLVILAIAIVFRVVRGRRGSGPAWPGNRYVKTGLLVLVFLTPLALNFYSPAWNHLLMRIPVLNASQGLSRWFAFYIPTLTVAAALALDTLPAWWGLSLARAGGLAVITFHVSEGAEHIPRGRYQTTDLEQAWEELHRTGQVPPITDIATLLTRNGHTNYVNGQDALTHHGSHLQCYEPIFGYSLEKFPFDTLHNGSVRDVVNGRLNVKDPACFLYPKENGCQPGDELPVERQADADRFLSYGPLSFAVPLKQKIANGLNLAALVAVPLGLSAFVLVGPRARWKRVGRSRLPGNGDV